MKAIYITQYGDSSTLIYGERERPHPKRGQLLVRVRAAGVNPRDWIVREGKYVFQRALPRFPIILGSDISGEVVEVGPGTSRYAVFGMQPLLGGMGGYAEFIAIAEDALARKPASVSHVAAAAVPCAGLTAWQAVHGLGRLQAGQRVTICGAGGGVGTYALQFAKAQGAVVTAVCGAASFDLAKSLGADHLVDYKQRHYTTAVEPQDLVFDAVGRDTFARAQRVLKPGGRYVSTIPSLPAAVQSLRSGLLRAFSFGRRPSAHLVLVRPCAAHLEAIARLMEQSRVRSVIDSVFPLEDAGLAQAKSRTWHAKGKIVLEVGA
jgi:NADPH:quinone reductase-like Zn-dependent oxidoreductase